MISHYNCTPVALLFYCCFGWIALPARLRRTQSKTEGQKKLSHIAILDDRLPIIKSLSPYITVLSIAMATDSGDIPLAVVSSKTVKTNERQNKRRVIVCDL